MTLTLELPADVEAAIRRDAERQNTTPEAAVLNALRRGLPGDPERPPRDQRMTPEERADAFVRWTNAHGTAAPPLTEEAVSRESLYADDRYADGPDAREDRPVGGRDGA